MPMYTKVFQCYIYAEADLFTMIPGIFYTEFLKLCMKETQTHTHTRCEVIVAFCIINIMNSSEFMFMIIQEENFIYYGF